MLYQISLFVLVFAATSRASLPAHALAKINGTVLTEEDARLILDKKTALSDKDIEKVVLFQLAVDKALNEKVDQDPNTATSIKKVLYKAYLRTIAEKNAGKLRVTKKELESYYNEYPLLRISQLVLRGNPEKNAPKIHQIVTEFKHGTSFRKLVLKYSEDQTALQGGDLDYRSIHNFPESLFNSLKTVPKNTLSSPHYENGNTLLFIWTDKKLFSEAPETFKTFLSSKLSEQRELAVLRESLSELRGKAEVEILVGEKQ